jgi:lycopene cyclase domain-containing protein
MKSVYFLVNFFAVIVPLVFSFHPKIKFNKKWKYFFPANIIVAVIFIVWDELFTRAGVWNFNERYISGIYISRLPVEEILFFICIPFSCVFTYHCLEYFLPAWKKKSEIIFCLLLSAVLITTGLFFYNQMYTVVAFVSTGILCLLFRFFFRVEWFGKALTVYAILLIPFIVVNGILTGTGLEQPVVIYNNAENLGIRILTIPVEDVFYGFELFLLNLYFYKAAAKQHTIRD